MAVEAWHSDHSAKRLPTQPIIQDTFTRAMFAVSSIANGFAHRQLYPEPPTAQGEEIGPKDPGVQTSGEKTALSKKAMALAALQDHPDWTDAKIADAAGCSRTTLYRWPDYKMARELLESAKATRPRGTKTKDGRVEAWPANQEE
jgi:AraC-like DNA-binding protein